MAIYNGIIKGDMFFETDIDKIKAKFTPDEKNRSLDDPNNRVSALLIKFFYTYLVLFDNRTFAITPGLEKAFSDKDGVYAIL